MRAVGRLSLCLASFLAAALVHTASARALPDLTDVDAYLFPGVMVGGTSHIDSDSGLHLGGEISGGLVTRYKFLGVLGSLVYDTALDASRVIVGAEVGWGPVGLDGGLLLAFNRSTTASGGVVGLFFSIGVAYLYGRYARIGEASFVEYGVGLKLPLHRIFWLSGDEHSGYRKHTRWRLFP